MTNKRLIILAVLLFVAAAVTACSGRGAVAGQSTESIVTDTPAPTEEPTPTPTPSLTPTPEPTEMPEATPEPEPLDATVVEPEIKGLVVIDPGHTGVQDGTYVPLGPGSSEMKLGDSVGTHGAASGLAEYELTMQISQQLKSELEQRGYEVILTHEDFDTPINCDVRATIANEAGADCLLRIHADGSENSSASGALAITVTPYNPWNPQTYGESRRFGECLLDRYCAATGLPDRGVLEEDNMTGNNWAEMACVLFEMGFMTNPDEDLLMADPEFQIRMVQGLADGVDQFFG